MEKEKPLHHRTQDDEFLFKTSKFELEFHLGKNIRYHSKRCAFFTFWSNTTKILSYFVGSATIVAILTKQYELYAALCNGIVLLLNACDSFIGFGNKARDYREFYVGYKNLEMELRDAQDENDLKAIWKKADQIELNEPNTLNVLMDICWNETHLYSGGGREELLVIKWWQRLPAQFIDIGAINITKKQ